MRQRRKEIAWKKNRNFGVAKGGRYQAKVNSVIRLLHELEAPGKDQELPILMQDRPPSDEYWPLSVEEVREALRELPESDVDGITHIWLRTPSSKMKRQGVPLSSLTTGRGVRVIMLHPWPRDRTVRFGRKRPPEAVCRVHASYGADPYKQSRAWYATFGEAELRRYVVEQLLFHSIGDHVFRWNHGVSDSRSFGRRKHSYSDDYAREFRWTDPSLPSSLPSRAGCGTAETTASSSRGA
ncbi:MAG: hypothetical protein AAGG01_19325 [Planctomycetota bacterium]